MKTFKYLKKHKMLSESNKEEVNENVLVVNDGELFKVNRTIDVPKKLINALIKKAKNESGKDPKIFWNEVSIADEIVKYILNTHLNNDSLPASILIGETSLESGEDDLEPVEGDLEIDTDLEIEDDAAEETEIDADLEIEDVDDDADEVEDVPSLDTDEDAEEDTEDTEED